MNLLTDSRPVVVHLSVDDLAARFGVAVSTIYRMRSEGADLPRALKIGGAVRWRLDEVERWEAEHESD